MKNAKHLLAALSASLLLCAPAHARDHYASAISAFSVLPVASITVGASTGNAALMLSPLAISAAPLVVKAVEASAEGTVYVLERVSDGARASVNVAGRASGAASQAVGKTVTASAIAAGTVLSVAGEVIAFIPNAVGQALLHSEQVSN